MSIGAAFLAAGASEVVGTLAPVGDRDAATLFRDLHRRLAGGESAAEALRGAQIFALHRGESKAWRALSVLTTRIN
jgi:CHAT domain-containing protein